MDSQIRLSLAEGLCNLTNKSPGFKFTHYTPFTAWSWESIDINNTTSTQFNWGRNTLIQMELERQYLREINPIVDGYFDSRIVTFDGIKCYSINGKHQYNNTSVTLFTLTGNADAIKMAKAKLAELKQSNHLVTLSIEFGKAILVSIVIFRFCSFL